MQDGERLSLEQIQAFLEASDELRFEASDWRELYEWVRRSLVEQEYAGTQPSAGDAVDWTVPRSRPGAGQAIGGTDLPRATRGSISPCWPRSMKPTRRSAGRPRRRVYSAR